MSYITWEHYTSPIHSDITINGSYSWGGMSADDNAALVGSGEGGGETPEMTAAATTTTTVTDYDYIYNGGQLTGEVITTTVDETVTGTETLYYSYDASGTPVSVKYNNTLYFYLTNLQGDVIAIMNGSGTIVVEYTYDAWGYIRNTSGSMKDTLGKANALRYRGYVYDTETCLYYLQSRYYNPGTGRFINADALVSTGQGLLGNNMFAYCANSPVVLEDSEGCNPFPSISDYYWMHKMVQYDIAEQYGFGIEMPAIGPKGAGRLDLYDGLTNQYYEVKHIHAAEGKLFIDQMEKYDEAHVVGWRISEYQIDGNVTRGTKRFTGSTQYRYWDIHYFVCEDGVVIYSWMLNHERYNEYLAQTTGMVLTVATAMLIGVNGSGKYQPERKRLNDE